MSMYTATKFPALPSLKEMDDANDSIRVELMLLRCLCTSDLAARYNILRPDTLLDITESSRSMLAIHKQYVSDREGLSQAEEEEFLSYCAQIEQYAKQNM